MMRGAAAALLIFEVIVVFLASLAAATTTDIDPAVVWAAGGGLSLLCIAAAATLRRRSVGLVLGSAAQVLAIASGFAVPAMFILGALFGGLWIMGIVLGRRIEAVQAAQ